MNKYLSIQIYGVIIVIYIYIKHFIFRDELKSSI